MGRPSIPIHYPNVGERELALVQSVLESRWLGMGPVTEAFEGRIRELVGAGYAVAVSSGSAALHLALEVLELGPGDEVVLPSMTHVAGPQAVVAAGGTPIFCDVVLETATIDPSEVARLVGSRTRVIMPVHYAGFACAMNELLALARKHDLAVVEDAAHAFGSRYGDRPIGSLGDLTCFSFDPVKNVTCGEGGAVTTDDAALAAALRRSMNLGVANDSWRRRDSPRPWQYEATSSGFRYHMSDINAAIGLAQLERIAAVREQKRELLRRYRAGLDGLDAITLLECDLDAAFPLLCATRIFDGRRDALIDHLSAHGIQAWVHFTPCHLQPAFARLGVELPATERLFGELLTLPLHSGLTDDDVDRVVGVVRGFLE